MSGKAMANSLFKPSRAARGARRPTEDETHDLQELKVANRLVEYGVRAQFWRYTLRVLNRSADCKLPQNVTSHVQAALKRSRLPSEGQL